MPPRSMRQSVWVLSRPSRTPTALGRQPLSVMVSRETALPPRRSAMRAALLANSRRAGGQARLLDRKAIALLTENPAPPQLSPAFHVKRPHRSRPLSLRSTLLNLRRRAAVRTGSGSEATSPLDTSAWPPAAFILPFHMKRRPVTLASAHRRVRRQKLRLPAPHLRTSIVPPGPLESRSRDISSSLFHVKRTRAATGPSKQRTHLSPMRPGRMSQPVLRPPSRGRAERGRTCIATRSRIWAPLFGLRAPRHIVPGVRDEWFCTIRGVGTYLGARALLVRTR